MFSHPPAVLVFAASDPSGGAGLQADLLTLAALDCHPLSVVTALTVQDTVGVQALQPVDAGLLLRQAECLLEDIEVAAVKLGVLGSAANARAIAQLLARHPRLPVVLDPVLASGRGDALADEAALEALRAELLPRTAVLTPNAPEARRLARAGGDAPLAECAARLVALGAGAVLVTGTHEATLDVCNRLFDAKGLVREDRWPRLDGSYHGSGCTLASALAAFLARGRALSEAVREAQDYTWHSLAAAFRPGRGQAIPQRFWRSRRPG